MQRLPIECNFIDDKDLASFPLIEMKYKLINNEEHLHRVVSKLPIPIRNIIIVMLCYSSHCFDSYDFCYLDVKVRELDEGESGDHLNQVHLDWTNDIHHPNKPETHFLYTTTGGTKFFDWYDYVGETLPNSIYKYHREWHQSPVMKEPCKRVMIRLSFVDSLR